MKKILFCLILIGICSQNLRGGEPYFRAKQGDQALLFQINGLSYISAGNFEGGLGYQFYFAKHWAFRFAIGGYYENDSYVKPEGGIIDKEESESSFMIIPGVRFNLASSSNILAYAGLQGLVQTSKATIDGVDYQEINSEETSTTFGGGLFLGAEWFAWENVSISAEYKLMYKYSSGKIVTSSGDHSEELELPDTTEFGLNTSAANFTISFYFN